MRLVIRYADQKQVSRAVYEGWCRCVICFDTFVCLLTELLLLLVRSEFDWVFMTRKFFRRRRHLQFSLAISCGGDFVTFAHTICSAIIHSLISQIGCHAQIVCTPTHETLWALPNASSLNTHILSSAQEIKGKSRLKIIQRFIRNHFKSDNDEIVEIFSFPPTPMSAMLLLRYIDWWQTEKESAVGLSLAPWCGFSLSSRCLKQFSLNFIFAVRRSLAYIHTQGNPDGKIQDETVDYSQFNCTIEWANHETIRYPHKFRSCALSYANFMSLHFVKMKIVIVNSRDNIFIAIFKMSPHHINHRERLHSSLL